MDAQKAPDGVEKLTGSVEGVIYANEQNGYTILDFGTDGQELVTLVGTMPYVAEGDELTVYGKWVHNPKYGSQFAVTQFEKRLPSDLRQRGHPALSCLRCRARHRSQKSAETGRSFR